MSVEIHYTYWPEYRQWTIAIRSYRYGPPATESIQEYVLPEDVVRGLTGSWMRHRGISVSARGSEAGAGSEGLALSTSRKSATPGPGESPAPPAEIPRADPTPDCEPNWSSEPLLTYWCNTHRRPGFRCEDEVKSRRQEDVLRAVVNLLETDLSGAPPRAADRDRNGNPTWAGLRRKILSEVQALISEGKK